MESNFWLQRIHFNDFAHNFDHSLLPIEADKLTDNEGNLLALDGRCNYKTNPS